MDLTFSAYQLEGLEKINVILGKNGCGKSTLLKDFENIYQAEEPGLKRYITPERGGVLTYEPGVERNLTGSANWLAQTRRVNQFTQFREQTMAQYRRLETLILRESEERGEVGNFSAYLESLNGLLDHVMLKRGDPTFDVARRSDDVAVGAESLSSGESELITLGIEALVFARELEPGKENFLLLDEPDVHLHPDLQARLIAFLTELVEKDDFRVLIATHSTPILGALSEFEGASVSFMRSGDKVLSFHGINESLKRILPVFGAHPLSNVFNERPILIVEGEDDERVWQQAVRSSKGRISIYPVATSSVSVMSNYEKEVQQIVASVYDAPRAYSLRDRDDKPEEIDDLPPVTRMRLSCRTIENLILCDEVLASAEITWEEAKEKVDRWIDTQTDHVRHADMVAFRDGGCDRKNANLKQIRLVLADAMLGSTKSWEVLVGKVIAATDGPAEGETPDEHSLAAYLGAKASGVLLPAPAVVAPAA